MITTLQKMLILPVLLLFLVLGRNSAECQEVHIQKLSDVYGIRINDMLIDDNGDMLIGGKRGLYDFYIAKLDTSNFNILWDSAYSDPWCGNSYNEVFDVALHPQGGYLATVLIHECGTSNYDPGIYWFSEDGELLERTEYYMWTGFHQNHFGVNPFFKGLTVRDDGHILSLYQQKILSPYKKNSYSILFEYDRQLNLVQFDTLNTNWTRHDLQLDFKDGRLLAYGSYYSIPAGIPYFSEIDPYSFEKKTEKTFNHDIGPVNSCELIDDHAFIAYTISSVHLDTGIYGYPRKGKIFKYHLSSEIIADSLIFSHDSLSQSAGHLNKIAENHIAFFRKSHVTNYILLIDEHLKIQFEKVVEGPDNSFINLSYIKDSILYFPFSGGIFKAIFHDLHTSSLHNSVISLYNISSYPNPADNNLTIHYSNPEVPVRGTRYTLYDITGTELMSDALDRNITQLNISHLTSGLYFLVISEGKNRIYSETISKL